MPRIARDRGEEAGRDARAAGKGRRDRPARPRRPRGVRRPRRRQDELEPDRREREPPRVVRRQLRRPRRHRHDAARAVRHRRAEAAVPAQARDAARSIAAYALTEPGSGSDALGAKTKAVLTPDGKSWKLTGTKQYITNAGFADLFTVFAKVDGEKFTGVPRRAQRARPHHRARGAQARHPRQLDLPAVPRGLHDPRRERARRDRQGPQDRVQHPQHRALEAGRGRDGRREVLPGDRASSTRASASSSASRSPSSISSARRSATWRRRSTSPSRWRSARRACSTRAAARSTRPTRRRQKKQIDAIEEHAIEASIIKVFGSEMLHVTADETLQIFGGAGYIEDYPIERVSRDARINRIFEGTNEINRLLVPGTLLKRALQGRLALMQMVGRCSKSWPIRSRSIGASPDGPLGLERQEVRLREARDRLRRVAGRAEVHAEDLREAGAARRARRLPDPDLRHGLGDHAHDADRPQPRRGDEPHRRSA